MKDVKMPKKWKNVLFSWTCPHTHLKFVGIKVNKLVSTNAMETILSLGKVIYLGYNINEHPSLKWHHCLNHNFL